MIFKGLFDFKNQIVQLRWRILIPVFILIFIGLLILSSTSTSNIFIYSTFYKQFLWFFIGSILFVVVQYVRIQYLYDYSYLLYFLLFFLLCLTFVSPEIKGAKSWIVIGPFYFQFSSNFPLNNR